MNQRERRRVGERERERENRALMWTVDGCHDVIAATDWHSLAKGDRSFTLNTSPAFSYSGCICTFLHRHSQRQL